MLDRQLSKKLKEPMGRIRQKPEGKQEEPKPLGRHVGAKVFAWREKNGVTQRALAKNAGLSVSFLCDLENGKRLPSAATLISLSRATGKPFGWWVQGFEPQETKCPPKKTRKKTEKSGQ